MGALTIDNVRKRYGETNVLKGIDIDVADGEFLILVGPSGCGKSTLLNMIAGLETITSGDIIIGERVVNRLSPKDRDIAMVFQSYALYPNMNVRKNIEFGLQIKKVPAAQREEIVNRVADILQMRPLLNRRPSQLSGGQRQRVAMGRAMAREPQVFLFDEPLSNLDAKLRVEMRTEIKQLHHRTRTTTVYVTHDQIEAMTLGDRIAVMFDGEIQQLGTPQQVYDDPANLFVAGFMGSPSMNFLNCHLRDEGGRLAAELTNHERAFTLPIPESAAAKLREAGQRDIILGLRPEHITHRGVSDAEEETVQSCRVEITEPTGPDTLVFITLNERKVVCRTHPESVGTPGHDMDLAFNLQKAVYFDP
ncbi:MAG TPA: sn-glycerol-3-phosphate ABC transporter ATP-binding protein UgpC, partial [Gammaproteobacteria bacterium]|nr:sn-glycerol-3-phosphate ABC transporter ATP-binding protein UgpC [Gammaproteobacteria bacterium]